MKILFLIALLPLVMCKRGWYDRPTKVCKDTYDHCSRRIHCRKYPDACKETCGLCRETKKANIPYPLAPRPHEPRPKKNCKDSYAHCDKRVHCPRYKDACKKTCGLCKEPNLPYPLAPRPECHDDLPHCADWNVDCKVYGDGCKKTCGLCDHDHDHKDDHDDHKDDHDDHKDDHNDHDTNCSDYYPDCPEIAANNWCPIYKGKCCKSCKKAETKQDPSCMDEASGCHHYKTFMCKQYPKKCKKTCGLCNGGFDAENKGPRAYGVFGAAAGQPEGQAPPDDESQETETEADESPDCVDVWADDCPEIAENNWCHKPSYKGKCCKSCKAYEENKGDCFDEEEGCVYYNKDNYMCENYGDKCKKTCKKCE